MITQKELKEKLIYSKTTGLFKWKIKQGAKKVGDIAGNLQDGTGYVRIGINGKIYKAHRLAWLYVYGEMPKGHIDHINHKRNDNRFKNLRDTTHKENHKNKSIHKNNTSGVAGVSWNKQRKKWRARININGKEKHIGLFKNKSDAINARKDAEKQHNFHKNHGV